MGGSAKVSAEEDIEINAKDAVEVNVILQSQFCLAYSHMLLHLHNLGNFISTWASGCHCHGWLHHTTPTSRGVNAESDVGLLLQPWVETVRWLSGHLLLLGTLLLNLNKKFFCVILDQQLL